MTAAPASAGPITSLPRDAYLSTATFKVEVERVFFRQWTFVAHVSQLPESGSFVVDEIAGESLLVVRDGDRVRAFFNVCRHRGFRFCEQATGTASRFRCPYHQWT
jgi:Rieske 2Fe-2S family protein